MRPRSIYFCFEGGGKMRTPSRNIDMAPGSLAVPLLFRIPYGEDTAGRTKEWPSNLD